MHGDAGHVPNAPPFRLSRPLGRRPPGGPAYKLRCPSHRKQAVMAGRILNRRELRKQADEAEARESPQDREATDEDDEPDAAADDDDEDEGGEEGAGGDAEA